MRPPTMTGGRCRIGSSPRQPTCQTGRGESRWELAVLWALSGVGARLTHPGHSEIAAMDSSKGSDPDERLCLSHKHFRQKGQSTATINSVERVLFLIGGSKAGGFCGKA